jgi:hypothetical protein
MNNNTDGKTCYICKSFKPLADFYKSSESKDGHKYQCKNCQRIEHNKRYNEKKNYILAKSKEWRKNNPEKMKEYWKKSSVKRKDYFKQYRIKNKDKRSLYNKNLEATNLDYKIGQRLRHRLYNALKSKGIKKLHKTMDLLGCDIEAFKSHLQSQFKNGMTWENYGKWHIDHINPCINFDLEKSENQKLCFHYTNMQPLWATDNLHKWKN